MICVPLLAAGEAWEAPPLGHLEDHPGVVVLKRCVDIDDLLAAVTSGQADVVVLALDAPGLDPTAVAHLRRHAVRPVAVTTGAVDDLDVRERAQRLSSPFSQPWTSLRCPWSSPRSRTSPTPGRTTSHRTSPQRTTLPSSSGATTGSWSCGDPPGAPGRTTVAVNLAAEVAHRGSHVVLADVDPFGGSVAQQLGILDEVSGLLSAARLAGTGQLPERFGCVCRGVNDRLTVVTGLPRADRWREVRAAHVEQLLGAARARGHVVVGAADPVGLARLARGLVDLRERLAGTPVRVVVNRMRSTIGWSEREIAGMVGVLPDRRAALPAR